jgi:hypothetical protein
MSSWLFFFGNQTAILGIKRCLAGGACGHMTVFCQTGADLAVIAQSGFDTGSVAHREDVNHRRFFGGLGNLLETDVIVEEQSE